ncbi:MAG: flavin reductase family protein [Clostridiales bacterium]|jgi:flavin reductase (DIM6/NTAB) family NADH-FMN oxidoreductase RutF|nr:flavin reductase family protein [Clostridiales bacterium]
MDISALFTISYGLYVLSAKDTDGRYVGCVINAAMQSSAEPPSMVVCSNKENYTTDAILRSGKFVVSVFSQDADMATIGRFGFRTSKDIEKFEGMPMRLTESGLPALEKFVCSFMECEVKNYIDIHTHMLIQGDILQTERVSDAAPLTYDYYHKVIKGLTPKKAVSYVKPD